MSQEIDDRAADWAARSDAGPLSTSDKAALDAWLAQDPRHLGSLAKARGVALHSERMKALGPNYDGLRSAPEAETKTTRRRVIVFGSLAASAAGIAVLARPVWQLLGENTYSTSVGQQRVISLDDGSVISLNTASKVAVRYTKKRRDIELYGGEALFDVAKDRARPFVVSAGGTQVRAVGTSFTVTALPDQPVRVLVREGVVEVKRADTPIAPTVRAVENTLAVVPIDAPIASQRVAVAEVNRALAWRVGRISFGGETLGQAAAQFARYSDTKIIIDDPEVANLTVAGIFVSDDPVGFARAVAVSFNLHESVEQGDVRLTR